MTAIFFLLYTLQNLGQPRLEDDLPQGLLAVPLFKHQVATGCATLLIIFLKF